ncbi:hypothetical protein KSC_003400 [Ktedonobacter sp. SOSP1-52]|nr:hypothetical protein KSC_003400 [Ktedonobacter sp. SOSP1-52]
MLVGLGWDERRISQQSARTRIIGTLQTEMREALASFNRALPTDPVKEKVRILDKRGGWISLSPLEAQEEPRNLGRLKAEVGRRWAMTSLLDILKEADLRIDFTRHFKSAATREVLERSTLRKRLLLSLYAMGTNTGLKRVSTGDHGEAYQDLLYVRRRYIQKEQLRAAIADVANAIFRVRAPPSGVRRRPPAPQTPNNLARGITTCSWNGICAMVARES